ncbi:MAG: MFS transporter [Alphaproteobacteria bacterium]
MTEPTAKPSDSETYSQSMRILTLVSGGHALSNFYILCLPPLIPLLKEEFDVSYAALGLMISVRSLATGFLQLPMGFLVDRFGGKNVLTFGLIAMSLSVGMIALVPDYTWTLAAMALLGVGVATIRPSNYTILNASMPPTFIGRSFGINMFAGHSGRVVAPPLIIFAAALWGWRVAVLIAAGIGLLTTIAIVTQWQHVRDDAAARRESKGAGFVSEVRVLASYSVLLFFFFYLLQALATNGLHSFVVAALAELHQTPLGAASTALTAYLIASAVGVLAGGFLVDKTPRHELVAVAALVASAALLVALGTVSLPIVVVIVVMAAIGIFQGTVRPARDMMIRDILPKEAFGKAISMVATGAAIGGFIAPVTFGWIMDIGQAQWLFYLLAACLVLIALTVLAPKQRIVLPRD